ncbi:MAG: hypothetical protein IJA72_01135 [Clostridia bacterium]|nr:hypothetical protein [Clostridia bacterium]
MIISNILKIYLSTNAEPDVIAPCGGLKFDPEYFEIIDGVITLKQSSDDSGG